MERSREHGQDSGLRRLDAGSDERTVFLTGKSRDFQEPKLMELTLLSQEMVNHGPPHSITLGPLPPLSTSRSERMLHAARAEGMSHLKHQIMVLANVHDLEKLQARLRYGG